RSTVGFMRNPKCLLRLGRSVSILQRVRKSKILQAITLQENKKGRRKPSFFMGPQGYRFQDFAFSYPLQDTDRPSKP
ncbi:MAG: hypothetical protein Q8S56_10670, partial [Polaromonas sp.]|nr:hypothetical protein [Polaromonas sp.]